jgi:hypothetical protein
MRIVQILTSLSVIFLASCSTPPATPGSEATPTVADTTKQKATISRNSLNVPGEEQVTYIGDKPCSDCKTTKVILTLLNKNNAVYREQKIREKSPENILRVSGSWIYSADSTMIIVTNSSNPSDIRRFKVSKDYLTVVDEKLQPLDCGGYDCTLDKIKPGKATPSKTDIANPIRVMPADQGTIKPVDRSKRSKQ